MPKGPRLEKDGLFRGSVLAKTAQMSDSDSDDPYAFFAQALGMFGDTEECHGEAGETWTYSYPEDSDLSGQDVELSLNETTGENMDLFAHYVWNSAIRLCDLLSRREVVDVRGRTVCELGSGSGLPSITACRLGASHVVATDYPDKTVIDNLTANVAAHSTRPLATADDGVEAGAGLHPQGPGVAVAPLKWGESAAEALAALRRLHEQAGGAPAEAPTGFDVVICADTLWMPHEHASLARSIRDLLAPGGVAIVAFTLQHDKTFDFFDTAKEAAGLASVQQRVEKIPVMWNGKEVEKLDDHAESKRTVWVYEVRRGDAGEG